MADASVLDAFQEALSLFPDGYSEGMFEGSRWGATVKRSVDGKRIWLFAEQLGGAEIVSFNLYRLDGSGDALKPCEMSSEKIIAFVRGFRQS